MRTATLLFLTLVLSAFYLGGCATHGSGGGHKAEAHGHSHDGDHHHDHADCSCSQGKAGETTWCEPCNKGYIDGKATNCRGSVKKALGTAGGCDGCGGAKSAEASAKKEVASCSCGKGKAGETTWCKACNAGYVDGKKTKCKACFDGKAGGTSWCDGCNKGYIEGKSAGCKGCVDKAAGKTDSCAGCGG